MAATEWMIRGPQLRAATAPMAARASSMRCPPTAIAALRSRMHIDKGHLGKVKLDGLNWAAIAAWPGAIHEGHGEILPIVDERATPEQREALLKIMSGQETEPGATFFKCSCRWSRTSIRRCSRRSSSRPTWQCDRQLRGQGRS